MDIDVIIVSQPSSSANQAPSVTIQNLYRDTAFSQAKPASLVTIHLVCCDTNPPAIKHPPVTIHLVYCDTNPQPSSILLSRYTDCIVTLSQASQASCFSVTIQWLYRDTLTKLLYAQTTCPKLLWHNIIFHCIVTQLGSSPFNWQPFFFFTYFFFISATGNTRKYISIFFLFFSHSPVYLNKFIKIYLFIYFSSVLHTVKP